MSSDDRWPRRVHDVFLTGDEGFIGRKLTGVLEARGYRVSGSARSARCSTPPEFRADLANERRYGALLEGVEVLVHLAAVTGRAHPARYFETNVRGTEAVLRAAERAGVKRILFVSSIAVTFRDKIGYPYAQSKERAEQLVSNGPIASTIVRPTMVFGRASPVVRGLMRLASLPLVPAFGGAQVLVQPVLVDDLAEMLADLLEADPLHEPIELGGPETVSMREVLDIMHRRARGRPARFVNIPLSPLVASTRWLERVGRNVVPFTVGQLATFRFDGTARTNPIWEARRGRLASVDDMIRQSIG